MIKWIAAFALIVIIFGTALDAFACTVYTIINPDGTYKNCVVCGTMISCS
jgi:hypothetical protein